MNWTDTVRVFVTGNRSDGIFLTHSLLDEGIQIKRCMWSVWRFGYLLCSFSQLRYFDALTFIHYKLIQFHYFCVNFMFSKYFLNDFLICLLIVISSPNSKCTCNFMTAIFVLLFLQSGLLDTPYMSWPFQIIDLNRHQVKLRGFAAEKSSRSCYQIWEDKKIKRE